MKIYEPTTTITDLILGFFSIALGVKLWRSSERERSRRAWAMALAWSGVAALFGAASHGFGPQVSILMRQLLWKCTTLSLGLMSCFLLIAVAKTSVRSPDIRRWFIVIAVAKLATYSLWMLFHDQFIYVIVDYAVSMIVVAMFQLRDLHVERRRAQLVLGGIVLSFAAAAVQASGFSIHEQFNYNDLYHVVQLGASYLLYRGGLKFCDQP